ncbi:MAG TPA: glycoside hydrolase family 3 protein [Clostridiaceae bacterium]|nr:glycoside hydrolase family 3 protein [Clostridiaceae bacterium]
MKQNQFIKNLISRMTIEQKIGAVVTLGFAGTVIRPHIYEYIHKYHCGGFRLSPNSRGFGSYVDPKSGKTVVKIENTSGYKEGVSAPFLTGSQYKEILDKLQEEAMSRPLGIPLHFSSDQEGGSSANLYFADTHVFPKPMGIRASGDSRMAYDVAFAVARQCRAIGVNWIHSPTLDININPDNPRTYTRAYSDNAEEVIEYAEQACRGFKDGRIITAAKHFPGAGSSSKDPHYNLLEIDTDRDTLLNRDLLPYKVLIEKGLLPSVMVSHGIYTALDENDVSTVSKKIITGILREEFGFEGVITTDSMTMAGVAARYGVAKACALSLAAGSDLVLMKAENELVDETFATIREFVEQGKITEKELDEKVYRVLNLKYEYGLFTQGNIWHETSEEVAKDEKIISLSRLAARRSVIAARNNNAFPLDKDSKFLVIEQMNGAGANDAYWHPGCLYESCLKYSKNAKYLETAYSYDSEDKERIQKMIRDFDTVVMTNFYRRGKRSNTEFIEELLNDKTKKFILIANTPYKLTAPDNAENVIVTLSTGPENMRVVAGVLFGGIEPEGEWPVKYRL